jgi:predicted membrane protein
MNEEKTIARNRGHIWPGLFLLSIGGLLLLRQLGVALPYWLFNWPMLLIAIGLFVGLKQDFKLGGWIIAIFIGALFLADHVITGINLRPFIGPVILIGIGIFFIFRPRPHWQRQQYNRFEPIRTGEENLETTTASPGFGDANDHIDAVCMFGGIKKNILSKSFKGGDVVNIMGGSELNLTMSDINGKVIIDATCIFGGTKLIVPSSWDVHSEVVAIFGGVDDKRQMNTTVDANKILVLRGVCLFGGIEIKSF